MSHRRQSIHGNCSGKHEFKGSILLATVCLAFLFAVMPTKGGDLSNQYCPVTTSELAEEQFSVDYQGRQIYFCCNKCKKDFLSNPETYLWNNNHDRCEFVPGGQLDSNSDYLCVLDESGMRDSQGGMMSGMGHNDDGLHMFGFSTGTGPSGAPRVNM